MPLFSRSSFRTPKKPPRRKADSLPNISALDDSFNFTSDSMVSMTSGAVPAVSMKLGDQEIFFEKGEWVSSGGGKGPGSRDFVRLQKQNVQLSEENNLLKYKVELLLDMLAASNADFLVMQKEVEALKKSQTKKR
ncbi:protein chibby homolog 1-like [Halichondria panicea]|uniref:protein chibby homolog 1-like n=1 Tax=Halichondria panicea TaxID=6063 RepID=UPI00312BA04C